MKIAIIGAAGNVGQRIVREALSRGHEVTALGPNRDRLEALGATKVAVADITDPAALTSELSLISVTPSFTSAGTMRRKACGSTTKRIACACVRPTL